MPERHTIDVDGDDLVAVHHPAAGDRWLVFSHGFASDKSGSYEGRCERAVAEGYDAVRFDHRGCGESDRAFDEQSLETRLADLRAVLERFEPSACVLFGSSFGGAVALHGALEAPVEAVAVRAPVTDTRVFDGYRDELPPAFFAALDRHPFERVADDLSVPVLLFHGRADGSVPLSDSLDAAGALSTDVSLEVYADEGHRFSRSAEARMRDRLFEWLNSLPTL